MKSNWRKHAFILSLASAALVTACSGGYEVETLDGGADEQPAIVGVDDSGEFPVDENGTVVGTSWQALYYPYCMTPWADPDGDGWGWEYNRSCIVYKAPRTTTTTTTTTTTSTGSTCANAEGAASTMAAIAVSAAMELGRWQPTKDFAIVRNSKGQELLALSSTAKSRCVDECANTQALLDFQMDEADGKVKFPGNVTLSAIALRSRLVAKYRDQIACEMQPSNGGTTNCPVEDHVLTFQRSEKGGCDTNYYFVAKKPDGSPLQYPGQLKNKLLWVDRVNPYIGFQSVGEVVSIDPTYGLNERGSTSTGDCSAACVKIGLTDVSDDCCSCGGVNKTFSRSAWSRYTYICQ